jgi:hypothetical protein
MNGNRPGDFGGFEHDPYNNSMVMNNQINWHWL